MDKESVTTNKNKKTVYIKYLLTFIIPIIFFILLTTWIFYYRKSINLTDKALNAHAYLCTLGSVCLIGMGELSFRFTTFFPRIYYKMTHASIMLISLIISTIGFYAIVNQKRIYNQNHFISIHSWFGLISIIILFIQFIVSALVFLLPCVTIKIRTIVKHFHVIAGKLVIVLSTLSSVIGMSIIAKTNSDYKYLGAESLIMNFIAISIVSYCITILYLIK